MRPPNNDALTDYAVAASAVIIASIPVLWITVLLLALASCGAQPAAANEPNYSRNSNSCPHTLPYPDTFAKIKQLESANGTAGVGLQNNLYGMQCTDRPTVCGCEYGYAVFACPEDALTDLLAWVAYSPPLQSTFALPLVGSVWAWREHPYCYLYRRNWQPRAWMPAYWAKLQTLNL